MKKMEVRDRLEPLIYERLAATDYQVIHCDPTKLISWNRLDLGFKLFYLDNIKKYKAIARKVYKEDIRSQTRGTFSEIGSNEKNSFKKFEQQFFDTYDSISTAGFDGDKTLIPLSLDGSIINGAHRTACAIHLRKTVSCLLTERAPMICDYSVCYERNVPQEVLDIGATTFIEYAKNIYIAFLWPSGIANRNSSEECFNNVVYKKHVSLSPRGAFNLLVELYRHMDWVGNEVNGFPGAKQKLLECFPSIENVLVVVFQENSIDTVREIKQSIRDKDGIGFSSVHITDTHEEAVRISRLIFNDNGLHFLNNADLYRYSLDACIEQFKKAWECAGGDLSDVVLDSSIVLALYGIRKNADVDYISTFNIEIEGDYESHQESLVFHNVDIQALVYDPGKYFFYKGVKFVAFKQVYEMKKNRAEEKDRNDLAIMKAYIDGQRFEIMASRLRQQVFYLKLKSHRKIKLGLLDALKLSGLYTPVRYLYRKAKGLDN